ncbi:MAG: cytochrome c peroxidase [Planctomycetota bacterium]
MTANSVPTRSTINGGRPAWRRRSSVPLLLGLLLSATGLRAEELASEPAQKKSAERWREPIGLCLSSDERFLVLALRKAGEIVTLDLQTKTIVDRLRTSGRLECIAKSKEDVFVAVDSEKDKAIVVRVADGKLTQIRRIGTGPQPTFCTVDSNGRYIYVSNRVGKTVESFDLAGGTLRFQADVPFEPHCLLLAKDERHLIVADAYKAQFVVLEAGSGSWISTRAYPGTNVRGLAFSPDGKSLSFTHQILTEKSMITRDAIFWGALFTNNLRSVSFADVLKPQQDGNDWTELEYLGDSRRGAGDPGAIAMAEDGTTFLCLSGVDELGIQRQGSMSLERLRVGTRPVAVALSRDGRRAHVACAGSDDVAIVELLSQPTVTKIPLAPPAELTSAERGELLFSDARLSLDGWFSCQSCHTDGHTNGSNADTDGDGNYGAPKNTPSLLGVADTPPWGWTGRFDTLEEQIKTSMVSTLHGNYPSKEQIADLATYLRTLRPRQTRSMSVFVERGKKVFLSRGCANCHEGDLSTNQGLFDVGLDDELGGHRQFNPPSLRGVGRTAPYLHDGRAERLEVIFRQVGHPEPNRIPEEEIAPLVDYLKSL